MEKSNLKLKIKLFLKSLFNKIIQNKNLKNSLLRFFGRDYELNQKELQEIISGFNVTKQNLESGDFIVSLTTFPQRIQTLKYTLYSIVNQNLQPKKIILSLSTEEFKDKVLPDEILEFQKYGLEILWNDSNLKQYNKIIPILEKYKDDVIITLDDDIYYPQGLLKGLFEAHLSNKNVIWCQRARMIKINNGAIDSFFNWKLIKKDDTIHQNKPSFRIFLEGVGGVLYPPNIFYKDVNNISKFMKLSPKADDVWLWAMAVLNMTKIGVVKNNLMSNGNAMTISPHNTSLWLDNLVSGNDRQIKAIVESYPQILSILCKI